MSYDLMVFEPTVAPRDRSEFMTWYEGQTQWSEGHSFDDPNVSSPALQKWFEEMIQIFPPMNGPLASDDVDDSHVTDHCISKDIIYSAFAWSVADEAHPKMRELAIKHRVGFFDVSSENGEILFPDEPDSAPLENKKPWWKFW